MASGMSLEKFIEYLTDLPDEIDDAINNSFLRESRYYLRKMKQYSPRDTGQLSDSWNLSEFDIRQDNKKAVISNNLIYAEPIEFGSADGKKPWPSPGPRTMKRDGRIFSIQAMGGVAENAILDSDIDDSVEHMANDIVKRLS